MHDCKRLRDDIWEAVEAGSSQDQLQSLVGDCETCRREIAKARSVDQGFQFFRTLDAPDCSSVVMARIDSVTHKGRMVWAYALAIILVTAVVSTALVMRQPNKLDDKRSIVRDHVRRQALPQQMELSPKTPEQPVIARKSVTPHNRPKQMAVYEDDYRIHHNPPAQKRESVVRYRKTFSERRHSPIKEGAHTRTQEQVDQKQPDPTPANPSEQAEPQITIVVMEDHPNLESGPAESVQFSYTSTNPETGDIIECSAKRTGESVELNLEVKPATNEKPLKGSLDYDSAHKV